MCAASLLAVYKKLVNLDRIELLDMLPLKLAD